MRLKKIYVVILALAPALLIFASSAPALAASVNYSDLIDDSIFDNNSTMSASQIDAFLNGFSGSCISSNHGFKAPDPTGYNPTNKFTYGSNVTAGKVIYDAAQAYDLNPQVLLTTLQKEQSLVTGGGGCSALAYTAAMGYNCPDGGTTHSYSGVDLYTLNGHEVTSVSGTCVSTRAYAGFSQQVINAAWLLKFDRMRSEGEVTWYINKTNWNNSDDLEFTYSGYMTQGTWQRQESLPATYYDGYATIDSTSIHINNGATAALYDYTPHKSGNNNFDTIFTSWFGPALTSGFSWQYMGQSLYTNSSKMTSQAPSQLIAGQRYYITIQAKNVGTQTWTPNVVHLATAHPTNRHSSFYDSTWLSPDRPARLDQSSVAPGQTGSFSFWITAPKIKTTSIYKEYFQPVADGYAWMTDYGLNWQLTVQPQKYTWQYEGQNAYTDQTKSAQASLNTTIPGERVYLTLSAKNTGNMTWRQGTVNLATSHNLDRDSAFHDSTWFTPDRPATLDQATVAPGQTGTFSFWVRAPLNKGGDFKEYFQPVADGITWMTDYGVNWRFDPPTPQYTWQYSGQGAYTDQTKSTSVSLDNLTPGERIYLTLSAKNTGNAIWYPGDINLAISHPTGNTSLVHDSTWMSPNRTATIPSTTMPGQTATFGFWATVPNTPGTYQQYFQPVADGITWMTDYGVNWQFVVQ